METILRSELEAADKRIIVLESTIESYKQVVAAMDKRIELMEGRYKIEELEYELEEVIYLWQIAHGDMKERFGDEIDLLRMELEKLKK